jgi:hypothetical protein
LQKVIAAKSISSLPGRTAFIPETGVETGSFPHQAKDAVAPFGAVCILTIRLAGKTSEQPKKRCLEQQ